MTSIKILIIVILIIWLCLLVNNHLKKRKRMQYIKAKNKVIGKGPFIKRDLAKNPKILLKDTQDRGQVPMFPDNNEFTPMQLDDIYYSPFMFSEKLYK